MIERKHAIRAIEQLSQVYARPAGSKPEALADVWSEYLDDVTATELRDAVQDILRSAEQKSFPRPAEIRALVLRTRPPDQLHGRHDVDVGASCPICTKAKRRTLGRMLHHAEIGYPGGPRENGPDRYGYPCGCLT